MSGTLGAGYVDPITGMWVSTGAMPSPAQANAGWNPLRAAGNAIAPALIAPNSDQASAQAGLYVPPGAPQNDWTGVNDTQMASLYAPPAPPPAPPQAPQQPSPAPSGAIYPPTQQPAAPQPSPQASTNADAIQQGRQQGTQAAPGQRDYSSLVPTIFGAESGGKDNAKNPLSSASGAGQFIDNTWNDFISSPANTGGWTMKDKTNRDANVAATQWLAAKNDAIFQNQLGRPASDPELLASHMLGGEAAAALASNPGANAYDVLKKLNPETVDAVFSGNSRVLNKDMTAGQALASAGNFYGARGRGIQYAQAGNVQNDASGPAQPDQATAQPQQPPGTMSPADYAKIMGQFQQAPSRQQQLLTLAAGLMGGPTLGAGLSKGIGDMNALTMAYQNHYQQAQTALAGMGVRVQNNLANQATHQQNANTNSFRAQNPTVKGPVVFQTDAQGNKVAGNVVYDPKTQASSFVPIQGGAGVTTTAQTNADNRVNVPLQGDLAAAKAVGAAGGKDNLKTADSFTGDVAAAGQQLQDIADARKAIQTEGVNGSTVKAKLFRQFASMTGLPIGEVTPDGVSLSEKLINGLNNGSVLNQSKGQISRLTQGEFNALKTGYLNMNSNPGAAIPLLDTMEQMAKRRLAIGQAYDAQPDVVKTAQLKTPGGVNAWYRSQLGEQLAERGITSDPGQQTPSQYQKGSDGWQHVPTGGGASVRFRVVPN